MRTAPIVCPEESLLGARRRNPPFPDEGLTRRLRRGWWGCRPEGEVLSFEAKESTKESTRHGDSGKKASIAHFDGGARNVARAIVGELFHAFVRAPVLAFFRRQNGRAFFPPLPIAALLPRSWHWADLNGGAWDASERLGWLRSAKGQRGFQIMLACGASRRACRPTAVWACQQTGSRARPASREACRRAAVKPRPSRISPYAPARTARSPGSRGTAPCASREARCRTAVKPRPTFMSPYAPARLWRAVRGAGAPPLLSPAGECRRRRGQRCRGRCDCRWWCRCC